MEAKVLKPFQISQRHLQEDNLKQLKKAMWQQIKALRNSPLRPQGGIENSKVFASFILK